MHRATPIRERNGASQVKCFGFCTYAAPRSRNFSSLAVSAHTKSSRICSFSSHLNFNPFNTSIPASLNSSSLCTYKNRGVPHVQKQMCGFSAFPSRRPPASDLEDSDLAGKDARRWCLLPTVHNTRVTSLPAGALRSGAQAGHRPCIFNNLRTQFRASHTFSGVWTFPPRGVPPISMPFPLSRLPNDRQQPIAAYGSSLATGHWPPTTSAPFPVIVLTCNR